MFDPDFQELQSPCAACALCALCGLAAEALMEVSYGVAGAVGIAAW